MGQKKERVDIRVPGVQNGFINITVWEDARAMYVKREPRLKHDKAKDTVITVDFTDLNLPEIASLLEDSIRDHQDIYTEWLSLEKQWE